MTDILFLGSNWEALSTLKILVEDKRFNVVAIITQPDKPVGRKQTIVTSDIKKFALNKDIPVTHTEGKRSNYMKVRKTYKPDLIVCKSFGEMIPEFFLEYPEYGAINVHYSLLPKYRGAVPIQKAILKGEKVTGITYVKMVKALDAGGILKQIEEKIEPNDTNSTLRERLVKITAETIGDVIEDWVYGRIRVTPQDESKATYCKQSDISKENAFIDWTMVNAETVDRMVRAFVPWPIAWTFFNEKRFKIFECSLHKAKLKYPPGEYLFDGKSLYVVCQDDNKIVELIDVQLEGKNRMSGKQFAQGQDIRRISLL